MLAQAILIPTLPPESNKIQIPISMNEAEQARLVAELGVISTEIARVQTRDEERAKFLDQRFKAIDARLAKIEHVADSTGQHDLNTLQRALDKRDEEFSRWKWWALSIAATLATSAIVGLVVHWASVG